MTALASTTSQGYPLISVDISNMTLTELTPEWASRALSETTHSSAAGTRKNYVYLNPVLYPLYAQLPAKLDRRHQFVVFANDEKLRGIEGLVTRLRDALGFTRTEVPLAQINGVSPQARRQLENLGEIVGPDWSEHNDQRCLTISLNRVKSPLDVEGHLLHICIASLLAGWGDCLVGYKYELGALNRDPEEDIWLSYVSDRWRRILPKRLADPISRYVQTLASL